jgi:hypothetical protein
MVSQYSGTQAPIPAQQAPDPDNATLPPDQPAGTAADASQRSTLGKMWDSWTSRPENNAAMINFGLALMSPIGPGESRLGHFAQAIGAGAEGSSANVAAQEARERAAEAEDIAERKTEVEEERGGAYAQAMRNRNAVDKIGMQQLLRQQADWKKWTLAADKGDDIVSGQTTDPVIAHVRSQNPAWAKYNKSQIMNDPGARAVAEGYIKGGPSVASGPREGATATGPDGQRIILRGGQWVPMTGE